MLREVKYRFLLKDGDETVLTESYYLVDLIAPDGYIDVVCEYSADEILEYLQYTGLKDKNGVEIYEGDVLKGGVYKTYVVKWDGLSNHQNVGFNISYMVKHEFEVIGNIYENPELLETK